MSSLPRPDSAPTRISCPRAQLTLLLGVAVLALSQGCQSVSSNTGSNAQSASTLAALSVGSHRSSENIARNVYRHPVETLGFFGIEEDMTILEVLPGRLWYTEILAPFVRERGQYIVADYDVDLPDQPEYRLRGRANMTARFQKEAEVFGRPKIVKLTAPQSIDLGAPSSVDAVLTFRSTHGWIRDDAAERVYAAFFEVLKPGGVLGVVQHRAGAKTPPASEAFTGYVEEARVIELAEGAGFVLEAKSEINANPKDEANYEKGVWTLPPVLRDGEVGRARYLAIGESDRMTLRFRKPNRR